jgi:hypothetical protein
MSHEPPSEEGREAVLTEVERLHREYLEANGEFERILQLVLEGNQHSKALMSAFNVRKSSFDRYAGAAAKAAGKD